MQAQCKLSASSVQAPSQCKLSASSVQAQSQCKLSTSSVQAQCKLSLSASSVSVQAQSQCKLTASAVQARIQSRALRASFALGGLCWAGLPSPAVPSSLHRKHKRDKPNLPCVRIEGDAESALLCRQRDVTEPSTLARCGPWGVVCHYMGRLCSFRILSSARSGALTSALSFCFVLLWTELQFLQPSK